MKRITRRMRPPSSIRARFLLVVLLGAVVPLALIGVWLTLSVVRAGKDLLHSELDQSLQHVADAVDRSWSFRSGDLALLAANDVAQRLLAATSAQRMSAPDSSYLSQLFTNFKQAIPSFEYVDASGAVRWSSPPPPASDSTTAAAPTSATLTVKLPVTATPGTPPLGTMVARVNVSSLIPTDTALRLPNGARMQIVQRDGRVALLPSFAPDSLLSRNRFTLANIGWLAVSHPLADPGVDLYLAAPYTAYVRPFERAARTGAITLAIVSLLVLLFTVAVTTRLTGSLERLATAADAVAGGDLNHRVDTQDNDEVGRVGTAFNSMADNLRTTLDELSKRQALAAVGEYAASLSHEVRNGLTAVRVDLQRTEEKMAADAPARPLVTRSLTNVKRLEDTVTASLRVARGSRTPRRRIELRPVMRAAAQAAEGAFSERGASIRAPRLDGATAWVLGNAGELEQLFVNLLRNSAQALGRDGSAAFSLELDGPDALVRVTDSGAGISPENLEHVLDPFFSMKEEGTGLGLSVARQIAAAHGGSIRIESEVGKGTRVEVRLPLAAAPMGDGG